MNAFMLDLLSEVEVDRPEVDPAECPGDGCSSIGPCHWACDPVWCLEAAYAAVEEANEDACTVHGWAAYAA